MSRLRRTYDGPTKIYFVTTNTHNKRPIFEVRDSALLVIKNLRFLEKRKEIKVIAFVIMPDHVHLLFEIISVMNDSQIIHSIKSRVAYEISKRYINSHRQGCHALSESRPTHALSEFNATQSVAALGMSLNVAASGMVGRKYLRIWHRSFYDHVIKNQKDLNNHIDYIHYNPVKDGLVENPEDWEWSSYREHQQKGLA